MIEAGLTWIGPHADAIDAMGDKLRARAAMQKANVPVVPGGIAPIENLEDARRAAKSYGYPLALKASGGGGGKGLKIAHDDAELESAFETARREAEAYFKNPTIYAERYLDNPKHIELQILADKHGTVLHVGERDCSLQRRHQKLWEEAPARLTADLRREMRAAAVRAAQAIGYDSVGTIECLVADSTLLLPRNEHAHSSRAHRHRNGDGNGFDPRADSGCRRRTARFPSRRYPVRWIRHRRAG